MDQPRTQSLTSGVRTQAAGFFQGYINRLPPGFEERPIPVHAMYRSLLSVLFVVYGASAEPAGFHPRQYIAYRTAGTITVDGKLNEASWLRAPATELFGNMQAPAEPPPYYATRVKMLWDDEYLYFAAMMEDPDILATVTERDGPIYDDNDFEIFMDINSDGRWYYEFEMNALNVIYDVLIQRRAARLGIEWNIEGLRTAVQIDGTLNVTDDVDGGWTAEIAWPMTSLAEFAGTMPIPPHDEDEWRIGFVRVYRKKPERQTDMWMWSPHRYVRMHYPQSWGIVRFSTQKAGTQDDTRDRLALQPVFLTIDPATSQQDRQPGSMILIPEGETTIGPDPLSGPGVHGDTVFVEAFYMDRYEVTVAQYASFLNATQNGERYHPFMAHDGCGILRGPDGTYRVQPGREAYPMVFVTSKDAEAFAAWDGKRLPTHREWERACRLDDDRPYPWGHQPINTDLANYDYHYGGTVPVGSFPQGASSTGVHDMAGNVWEICAGTMVIDAKERVVYRGGGWVSPPAQVHASVGVAGVTRCRYIGFRCARDAQ